jgi:hypothetical protein
MTRFFSRVRSNLRLRRAVRRRSVVALLLGAVALVAGITAIANATGSAPLFLITPTGLNFGYVPVGSTSGSQVVTIKNVSGQSQTMSGSGGGAGVFGGAQTCQGLTLAPGASCKMIFAFSPTATGTVNATSSGTWNGQSFNVTLVGRGTS